MHLLTSLQHDSHRFSTFPCADMSNKNPSGTLAGLSKTDRITFKTNLSRAEDDGFAPPRPPTVQLFLELLTFGAERVSSGRASRVCVSVPWLRGEPCFSRSSWFAIVVFVGFRVRVDFRNVDVRRLQGQCLKLFR